MYGKDEKCTQNLSENLKGRNHLGDLGTDGRILQQGLKMWTGFIWLRIGTSGRLL
jgi:hypothetical protein